jgi:hypothetical protein
LALGLALIADKRTYDRGLVQLVVNYLIRFCPLLHSDELSGVVWLIIMEKYTIIGARWSSPLWH